MRWKKELSSVNEEYTDKRIQHYDLGMESFHTYILKLTPTAGRKRAKNSR